MRQHVLWRKKGSCSEEDGLKGILHISESGRDVRREDY